MKTIPLTRGFVAKVSDVDYADLRQFKWFTIGRKERPYAGTHVGPPADKHMIYMHRIVAQRAGRNMDKEIDHRNGDTINNMRGNLRDATHAENLYNRQGKVLAGSGVRGVYPNTGGRWQARLQVDGKLRCLGTYDTIAEAATVRKKAEKEHFGKFAP